MSQKCKIQTDLLHVPTTHVKARGTWLINSAGEVTRFSLNYLLFLQTVLAVTLVLLALFEFILHLSLLICTCL